MKQEVAFFRPILTILLVLTLVFGFSNNLYAQKKQEKRIIQFSGIVLDEDGQTPLPGVHLYTPKASRGTTTDFSGYFSVPLLVGDSIIITSVAHKTISYVIEEDAPDDLKEYFEMERDIQKLQELTVTPYATEREFKQAILALELPEDRLSKTSLNEEVYALMSANIPIDGASAYRAYQDRLFRAAGQKYQYQPNALMALTNPFAWAQLVSSIKRGDFSKRKKREKARKNRYQSY